MAWLDPSQKTVRDVVSIDSYGLSSDQIADVLDRDVRTIEHRLSGLGKKK
jgi:DNA-directed RNA polymerase specialized sigma24 family protein